MDLIDADSTSYWDAHHCAWSNTANTPFQTPGSVTSGALNSGDVVVQANTGARATLTSNVASGGPMYFGSFSSFVDATDVWTDQTTLGVFTPSDQPYHTNVLIKLDWTGNVGGLKPQFITFYDNFFNGNGMTDVGVLIAPSGSTAQGSNIYCKGACAVSGFSGAGWQVGGDNTGRNAGRFLAQNALDVGYCGDMQGNPLYGFAVYGGGYAGSGADCLTSMENGFLVQTGFDFFGEAMQGPLIVEHVRSESRRLASASGPSLYMRDDAIKNSPYPVVPGSSDPVGSLFYGGDMLYRATVDNGPFGGVLSVNATGGSTTTIVDTAATWTTSQFVGMVTYVASGTNAGCGGIITANTSTAITMSAGWTTGYWQNSCTSPDATSIFSIYPNMVGGGTVYSCATGSTSACASTGMTLVGQPEDTIGGGTPNGSSNGCAHIDAESVDIGGGGGSIKACTDSILKNVSVAYPGWLNNIGDSGTLPTVSTPWDWDVRVSGSIAGPPPYTQIGRASCRERV